jgi:hypothetical protein
MWRTLFIAIGVVLVIFGVEFLVVDKATWARESDAPVIERPQTFNAGSTKFFNRIRAQENKNPNEFEPASWLPWAMLSSGAIVILYSLTLRGGGGGHGE